MAKKTGTRKKASRARAGGKSRRATRSKAASSRKSRASTSKKASTTKRATKKAGGRRKTVGSIGGRDTGISQPGTTYSGGGGELALAPNAMRPGTTEAGRGAMDARRDIGTRTKGELEAPSFDSQGALNPPTGGTGAPLPGGSGIRETSDPNYTARSERG